MCIRDSYCPSLVRGQGYYTGMVFEITCPQFSGAVAGGDVYKRQLLCPACAVSARQASVPTWLQSPPLRRPRQASVIS